MAAPRDERNRMSTQHPFEDAPESATPATDDAYTLEDGSVLAGGDAMKRDDDIRVTIW